MKNLLIVASIVSVSSLIMGKSYEKEIANNHDSQKSYEKKAERKVTDADLKIIHEKAVDFVNRYGEEDILMIWEDQDQPKTSQGLKEKARQMNIMGEIFNSQAKMQASCYLAQADKDFNEVITANDYCEAYIYAFMKEMYQQLQNKTDPENK